MARMSVCFPLIRQVCEHEIDCGMNQKNIQDPPVFNAGNDADSVKVIGGPGGYKEGVEIDDALVSGDL